MSNIEKAKMIQSVMNRPNSETVYYDLLENMGDLKTNYHDYMTTAPIDCDTELLRLSTADYDLCSALLTMLLREDHFSNGTLEFRRQAGQLDTILHRMVCLLESNF